MKISIRGGGTGKGWSNYVTRKYVKLSKAERNKITLLSGNTTLSDKVIKSSSYKDNSTTLVLSFNGKITKSRAEAVSKDFRELFMSGFSSDEYCYDAVLHQNTGHDHIHIRIPTKNLLTDTQLRLYYHKQDVGFVNAIRDYLILKHDLPKPTEEHKQVLAPDEKKEKLIQLQRAKENRKLFDFSKKRGRTEAINYINDYIVNLHESALLEDFEDLKETIKGLDLEIIKIGQDFTGDFSYFTVADSTGQKIRLKGELYNEQFWKHSKEDRGELIRDNKVPRGTDKRPFEDLEEAEQKLGAELRKRKKAITERYEPARKRAQAKQDNTHSDSISFHRDNRGSTADEVADERAIRHATKQSNSDIQFPTREAINNDRTRTAFTRRAKEREARNREREAIFSTPRDRISREQRSLFEHFREQRESLYSKARAVVPERRQRSTNRRRNYQGIKQIVGKANELGTAVERFKEQRYRGFTEEVERVGNNLEREILREYEVFGESVSRVERQVEQVIEDREAPSYSPGMSM